MNLDDCWSAKNRSASGELVADATKFPSGMKSLADYVHGKGLKIGLYTCVGTKTCKGDRPGSYGHFETDAKTLAGWGVDFIKMDRCGRPNDGTTDRELYGNMSAALNRTGRPILFSLCQWGEQEVWEWGHAIAQMFRIQMDHLPLWSWPGTGAGAGYGEGTREIIEWMATIDPHRYIQQFGWLDPDFLMTLFSPTMDFIASRTEYTFWSVWSAPLLVSTDIRNLASQPNKREILTNPEVIAVNQDDSCTAASRLRNDSATGAQLWARDVAGGDKVVVLYNAGGKGDLLPKRIDIGVAWNELGWGLHANVTVRDLWARKVVQTGVSQCFNVSQLAARDVRLLRLTQHARTYTSDQNSIKIVKRKDKTRQGKERDGKESSTRS